MLNLSRQALSTAHLDTAAILVVPMGSLLQLPGSVPVSAHALHSELLSPAAQ
jgi:hypothetical protein